MISISISERLGAFSLQAQFEAPLQGVTALFGPSGCGKTTTLLAIAGLVRPRTGRIAVGERVLYDKDRGIDVKPENRFIGFVFQEARLFPHLSVRANLEYGAKRRAGRKAIMDFDRAVRLLDLGPLLERKPGHLSGGEKQRVAIGRAILSAPNLLLMDEPLTSLDEAKKLEFLPFLERLHETLPIPTIYVTHAMEEVAWIADWMVVMSEGRAIASGATADLMSRIDLPLLVNRADVGVVLPALLIGNDATNGITRLAIGGKEIIVPLMNAEASRRVRLRVLARDVAIATKPPEAISMQNILPCVVSALTERGATNHLVQLEFGGSFLLSLVTSDSVRRLQLSVGKPVFALVKSVASSVFM